MEDRHSHGSCAELLTIQLKAFEPITEPPIIKHGGLERISKWIGCGQLHPAYASPASAGLFLCRMVQETFHFREAGGAGL
jgi:hypothetical protein